MQKANETARERYSATSIGFHWLTALLVFITVPLGLAMMRIEPGDLQNSLFDLHRSFGATILLIAAFRVIHRILRAPVRPAAGVPLWQWRVAESVHWALYVLIIVTPLIGWAGTSAFPAPISYFGLFELPAILGPNRELSETLLDIHSWLAFAIVGLLALHICAALHHHFVKRDATLRRMLPRRS